MIYNSIFVWGIPMVTLAQFLGFITKILSDAVSGLAAQFMLLAGKNVFRAITSIIRKAKQRQKMGKGDFLSVYVDIEEILGDFSEKYRNIGKLTPNLSRWEFFRTFLSDIFCVAFGLARIAFFKLFGVDETPRV
jgi:hypothetical protein